MSKDKIVIVDDSVSFCEAMRFILDSVKNLEIKIYHRAAYFLQEYSANWRGLLLIDLFMPGMDGLMLLEELRKLNNNMYTIVISGHADKTSAVKAKELGADEFWHKPFKTDLFLEKIKQFS